MFSGVEREAIAREKRRRQALEQLEFEREREAALREQLEEVITEQLGSQIDETAFARMDPEEVEVVRDALVGPGGQSEEEAFLDWADEGDDEEGGEEAEIARLKAELEDSRRRQKAFEAYLHALEEGDAAPDRGGHVQGQAPDVADEDS